MGKDNPFDERLKELREQALTRMAQAQASIVKDADPKIQRLLHELNVHHIELELQNEELREAQQQLERSRDRYRRLFHYAPVGYIASDAAAIIMQANTTFGTMLDRDIAGLLNKPIANLIHAHDQDVFFARYKTFHKNPADKQLEIRLLRSDGTVMHARFQGRRIDSLDLPATPRGLSDTVLISVSDVTRRKAAEQAMANAKKQWEQTFDTVSDPIAIIDDKFEIVRVNLALADRLGLTPQTCIGAKCYQLLHEGNAPVEDCPHLRFLSTKSFVRKEIFNTKLKGYFITTITPFRPDAQDDRLWSVHVYHDISDRKRAEEERIKSRNLESIGTLAGGIAHDFNNILTALIGHIELAGTHVGNNQNAVTHLEKGLKACGHAKDLVKRLLTFSEGGWPVMHQREIKPLIEEIAAFSLGSANMDYRLDLPDDLPPVAIDDMQIKLVLQNVMDNAREAMQSVGTVAISAHPTRLTVQNGRARHEETFLRIDIRDHGVGIPPSKQDKIFDPYYSTKPMGIQKGMGLGLTVAHSIIKKHKGRIEVRSNPEEGTTVSIFLPATPKAKPRNPEAPARTDGPSIPDCSVLLMDDEKGLWDLIEQMLDRIGCRVDFAANADEALALFRQSRQNGMPYDAVLLDLTIPDGIGGKEVVRMLRGIDPSVKALAVSGYSTDPVFSDFRRFGFVGALKKPFRLEEFTASITRVVGPRILDEPPPNG